MLNAVLDDFPGGQDDQHRRKRGQDNQWHGDTIDTQVIVYAECADPWMQLGKLHCGGSGIELRKQWDTQNKCEYGYQQGQDSRALLAHGKNKQSSEDRQPDQGT